MNPRISFYTVFEYSTKLNQGLEDRLHDFVQCTLAQSYSKDYSVDEALKLLDEAWEAQKLLWQLRKSDL